jgi:hypothetical protein
MLKLTTLAILEIIDRVLPGLRILFESIHFFGQGADWAVIGF